MCLTTTLAVLLMAQPTYASDPPDLTGCWSGRWESISSGHQGPLSATFRQADATRYDVIFRGRFLKVIPFRYRTQLEVTGCHDDKVFLAGSRRLLFFGTFSYSAEATATDFTATYESRSDQGVFLMQRQ